MYSSSVPKSLMKTLKGTSPESKDFFLWGRPPKPASPQQTFWYCFSEYHPALLKSKKITSTGFSWITLSKKKPRLLNRNSPSWSQITCYFARHWSEFVCNYKSFLSCPLRKLEQHLPASSWLGPLHMMKNNWERSHNVITQFFEKMRWILSDPVITMRDKQKRLHGCL